MNKIFVHKLRENIFFVEKLVKKNCGKKNKKLKFKKIK
jgi:hypothetical protein